MSPEQPEYYLVKSLAEFNAGDGGNYEAAMKALDRCSEFAPQYVPMLVAKANLLIKQGKENEALGYLNAAVANAPSDAEALITRALLFKRLNQPKLLTRDMNIITMLSDDLEDLKGFALNEMERDNEALKWLQKVASLNMPGGENYYYAAIFMAMRGDDYSAINYLQKALDSGYGSLYKLKYDELSALNLKSLREKADFLLTVDKAQLNFVESD